MKNKVFIGIAFVSLFLIIHILIYQYNWFTHALELNAEEVDRSIQTALFNTANRIKPGYDSKIKKVTKKYYVVRIDDNIEPRTLQTLLLNEFDKHSLDLDFEIGIYDCQTDKIVFSKFFNQGIEEVDHPKLKQLNIEQDNYYFSVFFPGLNSTLFSRMEGWVYTSLLSLFIIVIFGFSFWTILKQQKDSEVQKNFFNNVAHELKTPLSTILIASEAMNKKIKANKTNDEINKLLQYNIILEKEAKRLQLHIGNVLNLASAESDKINIILAKFDLVTLLDNLKMHYDQLNPSVDSSIELCQTNYQDLLFADPNYLKSVLENLWENAIKYGASNIRITCKKEGKKMHLYFMDNGIGIPKKHRKAIFKKFYRIKEGDRHNYKGFGLGLSYVQSIMNLHQGKINLIDANPFENMNTVFQLTFKIK